MAPAARRSVDAEAGFDALLSAERRRLYGIAYSILRDHADAEDALQEAMLKAWKSWDRVRAASESVRVVLAEQERSTTLRTVVAEAVAAAQNQMPVLELAFGPEGGWAPDEEALFDANGWRAASLGPRILRADFRTKAALAL